MKSLLVTAVSAALLSGAAAFAQQPAQAPQPFQAGGPLGVTTDGKTTPISDNVQVFGALVGTESCSYDEGRQLIVAPARGANQYEAPNDGFVALINHDGSVHTPKWIGVNRNGLVLNHPFGSDIMGGKLYLADRDGGDTRETMTDTVAVVRMFDMQTGAPAGEIKVDGSVGLNDIEVAEDGTIYGTQTSTPVPQGGQVDPTSFKVFKISPDGTSTVLIENAPLARPNGIAFDPDGNIVVVNIDDDAVLTFTPAGELVKTEHAAMAGNDGLVIMPDGTKYISSVRFGGVTKITPDGTASLIAEGVPMAASMCYDKDENQLVIPMNSFNALAFIKLD